MWSVRWMLPLCFQLKSLHFLLQTAATHQLNEEKKNTWLTLLATMDFKQLQESCILIDRQRRYWDQLCSSWFCIHRHWQQKKQKTKNTHTNNLGQLFQIQLLWTWSQLVSGGGVCLAHTYQLGPFPKQYCTMLPRGLQQNKTLISLNVIVISYSSKKQHGYRGSSLEMSNTEQSTMRCLFGHIHTIPQIRCDEFGAEVLEDLCIHSRLWCVLRLSKEASFIGPSLSLGSFVNRLHLISYCLSFPPRVWTQSSHLASEIKTIAENCTLWSSRWLNTVEAESQHCASHRLRNRRRRRHVMRARGIITLYL